MKVNIKPNHSSQKKQTRNNIYQYLYQYGTSQICSKQLLAQKMKLSMPTIYQNLSSLLEDGLVHYSGEQQESTGGRKAQGIAIVPDARIAIGISITKHTIRIVAADLYLHILAYQEELVEFITPIAQLGALLSQFLEQFLTNHKLDRSRILGVGIAFPGIISPDSSSITLAPTLGLRNVPLDGLTDGIPFPCYVINDATCSGYTEWFLWKSPRSMAYISLENGVGGAIFVNGEPYTGNNSRSGEFGHICVEPGGLPCSCGKRGCLEAYCSIRRIRNEWNISLDDFFSQVKKHTPEYEMLWYDLLRHLAVGIDIIHTMLDCDIVLGGLLAQYMKPYMPLLNKYVQAINIFDTNTDFVHLGAITHHAVPLGATLHFIKEFLEQV